MPALRRWAFALFAVVLNGGTIVPSAMAELPQHSLADVVADVLPAVVAISASRTGAQGARHDTGSGFIIDPTGLIVTNKHVIDKATTIVVTLRDGTTMRAMLAGEAQRADIALLRVFPDTPLPIVHFGDSDRLRVAETVIAIGNPLGFNDTVTVGIVSGLNRDIMESPFDEYIQTDAAINHGNSGGPLIDTDGDVIGMNSVIVAPGSYGGSIGLGFAIPADELKFVTDQLRRFGHVIPGWIGARYQQITPQLRQGLGLARSTGGAIVLSVMPDSPAATAGLRSGDVVLRFNGQDIQDARALARAIAIAPIGRPSPMQIWRDSAERSIEVVALADPDSGKPDLGHDTQKPVSAQMPVRLGLQLSDLTQPMRASYDLASVQGGVLITGVTPGSAAANAGLQAGDLILQAEHCDTDSATALTRCLLQMSATGRRFAAMLIQHANAMRWVAVRLSDSE